MSAFICSDRHFATVAQWLFSDAHAAQLFADALKRENIKSVNHRYGEKTRFRRVNLAQADLAKLTHHDILCLLECINYQSCEHPTYNNIFYKLAHRLLMASGAQSDQSSLWSY
jgi:hypothetical protein